MIDIIIISQDSSKRFSKMINDCLSTEYKTAVYNSQKYVRQNAEIDFLIVETDGIAEIISEKAIVIFIGAENNANIRISKNIVAIVNSTDKIGLQIIANNKIKTITCGFSSKDTITISSITEDNAVISLQRNITAFTGEVIEQAEIPVKLRGNYSVNDMLILMALILMVDKNKLLYG